MDIHINRDEVRRYLGCRRREMDPLTERLMDQCLAEVSGTANPGYLYRIFEILRQETQIELKSTTVELPGRDIAGHLENCATCAVMAVTLGPRIDEKIRLYNRTDMAKAVVFDACSTAAVEAVCDRVSGEIETEAFKQGLFATARFSPGYGDLPLWVQSRILDVLDAPKKIGLTHTRQFILVPQKSVTAIVGLSDRKQTERTLNCQNCIKFKNCLFRREGTYCDNKEFIES